MKHLKRPPKAIIFIAVTAIGVGAATLFYTQSKPAGGVASKAPKPALTVSTVKTETTRLPIQLSANGSISAWQEAVIGSEVNGLRLTEVRVNVGDTVKLGQVLATFALDSVQAELAQSQASVAEAEANAADAAGNAGKARTLQASGAISEQQINQYLTLEKTAQAKLEVARATRTVQQVRLRQTQVLAPDSGVISARTATVGAVVGNGAELFRMIRGGRLEWRAEVTSTELGRLTPGMSASVLAANGVELKGRVRMIAPSVDPLTRSALVYVDLPSSVGKLNTAAGSKLLAPVKAGMFARGEFDLGTSTARTLPQQAVVIRDGFSYVFVLREGSHVSQRKVQIGRRLGERVEVVSGLEPDAVLVASGAGFLNDGDLVRVEVAGALASVQDTQANRPSAPAAPAQAAIK
jgi:RND family efflux transporter MFP subunit